MRGCGGGSGVLGEVLVRDGEPLAIDELGDKLGRERELKGVGLFVLIRGEDGEVDL